MASNDITTLGPHKRRLHTVVPDLAYVTKYTDQGPHPGNHWFWKDGRRNHGHDARGQAYVRWRVKPTAASGYFTHGDFNVARLLIEQRAPIAPRARIVNQCGLSQCINPDHWLRLLPQPVWRLQLDDLGTWRLVGATNGRRQLRTVVVHLRTLDAIHLAQIEPSEQRRAGSLRAVCGLDLHPADTMVTAMPVTCGKCV